MEVYSVLSLDMEGTLITEEFSRQIWEIDIPRIYSEIKGLTLEDSQEDVFSQYNEVGDNRPEWYDVDYWFDRLGLPGDRHALIMSRKNYCIVYPEVPYVLKRLRSRYPLVVTSNTIREFLEIQLSCFEVGFHRVFSAPSDFGIVKKSPEFYDKICVALNVEPEELVHVGDHREYDYLAAKDLGIKAYHLDRKWKYKGPDVIRDLEELEVRLSKS